MNCKPGDLAVYVGKSEPSLGWIAKVVGVGRERGSWLIDPPLPVPTEGCVPYSVYDSALRPIRPGDISDEEVRDLYAPKLPEQA